MKFSNYLSSIDNVGIYPVITLVLFFAVFVGAVIWIVTRDKEYISELERIPLDNDTFNKNIENENESNQ
jgi:cytochrome c oxidase cbb3-type subunit 3